MAGGARTLDHDERRRDREGVVAVCRRSARSRLGQVLLIVLAVVGLVLAACGGSGPPTAGASGGGGTGGSTSSPSTTSTTSSSAPAPALAPSKAKYLLRPIPKPAAVPPGVDPRLWDARPVQPMGVLQVSAAGSGGSAGSESSAGSGGSAGIIWGTTRHGRQLESTDTGKSWVLVNPPSGPIGANALGTSFSGRFGWLATGEGLYETTDGGTSWRVLPALPSPKGNHIILAWVQRTSPRRGWGVTNLDTLEKTDDAGTTWEPVTTPASQVEAACFPSATDGLIATQSPAPAVYATHDGGTSWTEVFSVDVRALDTALTCNGATEATLRLVTAIGPQGSMSETWSALDGWGGPWRATAGDPLGPGTFPPPATTGSAPVTSLGPTWVEVTRGGLDSVGVTFAGEVEVGSGPVVAGHLGAFHVAAVGTVASSATPVYTRPRGGVAFTSKTTGRVFVGSDSTGRVLYGATHDGGTSWTTTVATVASL